jgi:C-terminal processing protease CtpA/Prc
MMKNCLIQACKVLKATFCIAGFGIVAGCGGCGGSSTPAPAGSVDCSAETQKNWLRSYMLDWYLWSGQSPNPDPLNYADMQRYFSDLLYGGAGLVPADRWSYISDSASFDQFFVEGKTLGYGLSVNGLEQVLPLKARYIEEQSPAAAQGLVRGDQIESINGQSAANLIASGDFTALSPKNVGDVLTLQIRNSSGIRTVVLTAASYALTPMPTSQVFDTANGSKVGYLLLKDFITQAEAPMATAFNNFRQAGVKDVMLDLRYNGGGRVSTATVLASFLAGAANDGKTFVNLRYNLAHTAQNTSYQLAANASGFERVVVITGQRTCSASELVVNGLKPYVQVTTVGAQTCGKPVGFLPVSSCGSTVSAVNFESFNAAGKGGYYAGIAPDCMASDDFSGALGDPNETLAAVGLRYLQTGTCSPGIASMRSSIVIRGGVRKSISEPGEWRGMWAD